MKKGSAVSNGCVLPTARITRARAAALNANEVALPLKPPVATRSDAKQKTMVNLKRAASEVNNLASTLSAANQPKKRAVLKDVSNICREASNKNCIDATRKQTDANNLASTLGTSFQQKKRASLKDVPNNCRGNSSKKCNNKAPRKQSKASQQYKVGLSEGSTHRDVKDPKLDPNVSEGRTSIQEEINKTMAGAIQEIVTKEPHETTVSVIPGKISVAPKSVENVRDAEDTCGTVLSEYHNSRDEHRYNIQTGKNNPCEDPGCLTSSDKIDIDSDNANPQMCSLYAPDIYTNFRAAELIRRPRCDFMETLQRDITQSMRGILIDWLVEVSDEYRLVPDTLYLTVHIIDRFLSQNFIERQRLQLLGITCMLIASKYEEISAPRVEEFCFITDNSYTKGEVLKMESRVLNYLGFRLSVPTIKTFLRRFLQAAQASCKVPSPTLGYLANYLAELSLVEYSFLKFQPSVIAASAVFLARWTLDQSCHPWDRTLQHYSSYKASDLKPTVFALKDLQMNIKNCPLNSVREKYRQQKFKAVASLTSAELLPSLFC